MNTKFLRRNGEITGRDRNEYVLFIEEKLHSFLLGQQRNDCKKFGPGRSMNTISIPMEGLMITI